MKFFLEKQVITFSCPYQPLSFCKIFKKFFEQILRYEDVPFSGQNSPFVLNNFFFRTNHYYYFYLPISPFHCAKFKKIFLRQILFLLQLAHDVVTTLSFGCILVATSDNVVTTLRFRRRYYNQKLTLLKRCVSNVGFPTWY